MVIIMLPPEELKSPGFTRTLRGYSPEEVEQHIDFILGQYQLLCDENENLRKKLSVLSVKFERMKKTEEAVGNALLNAQTAASKLINETREKTDAMTQTAQEQCEKILLEYENKVKYQQYLLTKIDEQISNFKTDLFNKYRTHIQRIEEIGTESLNDDALCMTESEFREKVLNEIKNANENFDTEKIESDADVLSEDNIRRIETIATSMIRKEYDIIESKRSCDEQENETLTVDNTEAKEEAVSEYGVSGAEPNDSDNIDSGHNKDACSDGDAQTSFMPGNSYSDGSEPLNEDAEECIEVDICECDTSDDAETEDGKDEELYADFSSDAEEAEDEAGDHIEDDDQPDYESSYDYSSDKPLNDNEDVISDIINDATDELDEIEPEESDSAVPDEADYGEITGDNIFDALDGVDPGMDALLTDDLEEAMFSEMNTVETADAVDGNGDNDSLLFSENEDEDLSDETVFETDINPEDGITEIETDVNPEDGITEIETDVNPEDGITEIETDVNPEDEMPDLDSDKKSEIQDTGETVPSENAPDISQRDDNAEMINELNRIFGAANVEVNDANNEETDELDDEIRRLLNSITGSSDSDK